MNIASFDVFDTTLLRKCGIPQNVFHLMADELFENEEEKTFFLTRRINQERATIEETYKPLTLGAWDRDLNKEFGKYDGDYLIEKEKKIESDNLVGNPAMRKTIKSYRERGYKIIFISDMYLPSSFIKEILKSADSDLRSSIQSYSR